MVNYFKNIIIYGNSVNLKIEIVNLLTTTPRYIIDYL